MWTVRSSPATAAGPLGHPKVYLNLAPAGQAECPYCSRVFIRETHHAEEGHNIEVPSASPADKP